MATGLEDLLKMNDAQRKAWAQRMAAEFDPPTLQPVQAPQAPQQTGFAQMLDPQQIVGG